MAIKNTSVTLDGLKYNLDDRDRVAAQLVNENANTFTAAQTNTVGVQCAAVARTATSDGLTTGTIADGTSHVTVTSGGANTIIILPTPTIGNIVALAEAGTTGYEIRTHNPASCSINGVSGSAFESAVAGATTYTECIAYPSSSIGPLSDNTEGGNLTDGQWICNKWIADGTMAVAAVSDA